MLLLFLLPLLLSYCVKPCLRTNIYRVSIGWFRTIFNRLKSSDCEGVSRSIVHPRVLEIHRLPWWLSSQRVGLTACVQL